MIRILILCTGNSCRSQMAEAILRSIDPRLKVYSAGTAPAAVVHPKAIAVMKEMGIDIGEAVTKDVRQFLIDSFEYVITVCDHAHETCPVFSGRVRHRVHMGFDDPASAAGSDDEIMAEFRRVRDEIRARLHAWYHSVIVKDDSLM